MNNPLAQKYNYYLNESNRLSEELQNETEYSELLENILIELIGEEAFYGLFQEDVFDSSQSSAASRQNVKKATKTLGASSPHTKELAKLHTKMKNSRFVYGIADNEVNRREFGDENYGKKPTLTPMKGKSFSGYDAIGGTSDRSVNTGIINKAAAAIRKNSR